MQNRLAAFKAIASETISANERNYLLSAVLTESGAFDWSKPISHVLARDYVNHPSSTLLEMFRARVVPEQALGKNFTVKIAIEGEPGPHYWTVSDGILRYSDVAEGVEAPSG